MWYVCQPQRHLQNCDRVRIESRNDTHTKFIFNNGIKDFRLTLSNSGYKEVYGVLNFNFSLKGESIIFLAIQDFKKSSQSEFTKRKIEAFYEGFFGTQNKFNRRNNDLH
jgi:hypothetical protein